MGKHCRIDPNGHQPRISMCWGQSLSKTATLYTTKKDSIVDVFMKDFCVRKHQQKLVTLSGFWTLRGWRGLHESVKKGKFVTKIFFEID